MHKTNYNYFIKNNQYDKIMTQIFKNIKKNIRLPAILNMEFFIIITRKVENSINVIGVKIYYGKFLQSRQFEDYRSKYSHILKAIITCL